MSVDNDAVEVTQDELTTLKARADLMGVPYHPSISLAKLREKVNGAIQGEAPKVEVAPEAEETVNQKRSRMKKEMLALVRIRLTCMNPAKKEWPGEILTVGNSLIGSVKRYVPFNAQESGWHVERILLQLLKDRKCQIFQTVKENGREVRKGRLIPEFAIEELPPLTEKELAELARRQAMANGTSEE